MRLGIVGAGFVANFHVTALKSVRGVEVVGVTALKGAEELAGRIRREDLGKGKVFANIADMSREVDTIAIFIPNFARIQTVEEIAANSSNLKMVICEKPLARNVTEARKMVDIADKSGFKTAYFENQIFMPSVLKARGQLVNCENAMGPCHLVRSAEEHGGPHESWFWDPTRQGGGVLCDMGCHSIAVGWFMLTPAGQSPTYLRPAQVSAQTKLLKWGLGTWKAKLLERGVDYNKTPAEDYAIGTVDFTNPDTGQKVTAQFTDSWMYDAPGLRLLMEAFGPGFSYTVDSLQSPAGIFISDAAAETANAELALEKSQSSRGALVLQPNEADLYGYVGEWQDALNGYRAGENASLGWKYGLEIVRLVMASYMSAERGAVINLQDPKVLEELETYIPLIQQGRGGEVL
ncbi:MAG: Gfo/Idh/MocA family oxidoreductase [Armatimonadetes bacterium]|nr:Gfo/Idh/MocA family oxidoreductase [Armatimonadota bacterium]